MLDPVEDTAALVRRLEQERCDAMIAKDVATLEKLLDDQLVYTHSSGVIDTKRSYIDGVAARQWDYKSIDRLDEKIITNGTAVLVFNRTRMDIDIGGVNKKLDNNTVAVWLKHDDGQWNFVALGSTARMPH